MNFKEDLFNELNLEMNDIQEKQFEVYYQFLIEYNKITNLTRITEKDEVYYKHFFDSLTLAKSTNLDDVESMCDMGSGAGFPSIPLKIMYPHLHITIVDSLNKRIVFLQKLAEKLNIKHTDFIHDRVENYALTHQETFDLVTARALGSLSLISEMGIPMTKIGGRFIALKGNNYEAEFLDSKKGIEYLGCQVLNVKKYILPNQFGTRFHIVISKTKHIKGFPRQFSIMSKKPL